MKKIYLTFLLLVSVGLGFRLSAQVPAPLVALLNHTLDSMRQVTDAKSLSAAIQFTDGNIWNQATGISSLTQNATTSHAYLIGSVTKTITAACIMQLVDENALSLDDSLHQWLDTMLYIDPNITIRQLLNHTSGLFDVLAHPNNQDSLLADVTRIWWPEELIERFIMPPNFIPGTAWGYSNTNYMLLAMIIKAATSNDFFVEYHNRFFVPMGLSSFASPAFEFLMAPVAHVWMDLNGDNVEDDAHTFYMNYKSLNSTAGAAGSYFATPTDCTKWMRNYMGGNVITPASMAQVKTTVFAPGSQGGLYGLGIMKNSFQGLEAWGHGGDLAYHASSWYLPAKDASITVFTNDNSVNSWELLKVVEALIRSYNIFENGLAIDRLSSNFYSVFKVYPNPFENGLTIGIQLNETVKDVTLELQSIQGQTVTSQIVHSPKGVLTKVAISELENLPAGVYLLLLKANGVTLKIEKVIKA